MLELWGIWTTPSLPLLLGSLWPRVVVPDRGLIYGSNRTVWRLNCVLIVMNWQQELPQNCSFIKHYSASIIIATVACKAAIFELSEVLLRVLLKEDHPEVYHNIHPNQINLPPILLWCMAYSLRTTKILAFQAWCINSFFKIWVFTRWTQNISNIFLLGRILFYY